MVTFTKSAQVKERQRQRLHTDPIVQVLYCPFGCCRAMRTVRVRLNPSRMSEQHPLPLVWSA